jgi:hypothetical protein
VRVTRRIAVNIAKLPELTPKVRRRATRASRLRRITIGDTAQSKKQKDREFWVKIAQRWEELLLGLPPTPTASERPKVMRRRFAFANRSAALLSAIRLSAIEVATSVALAWPRWNNQQRTNVYLLRGLEWGLLVIAMLHKADFFQEQNNQCRRLAAQASNKNDREFWLQMTQRWEGLLIGRYSDATAPERVQKIIFRSRRRFANRYRAA